MECFHNYRWYLCQEHIPYFRLRIYKFLAILSIIVGGIVLLPPMGIFMSTISDDKECITYRPAMFGCYIMGVLGLIVLIFILLIVSAILFIFGLIIHSIWTKGIVNHCLTPYSSEIKTPYWMIYIIVIVLLGSAVLIPLCLDKIISRESDASVVGYIILLVIELVMIIGLIITCLVSSILAWNQTIRNRYITISSGGSGSETDSKIPAVGTSSETDSKIPAMNVQYTGV